MKPPKPPKYVPGLDDLPSRSVGPWVGRKVHFTDRFTQMFAIGMKNRWPRRSYIELFAGPGQSFDRARGVHLEKDEVGYLFHELPRGEFRRSLVLPAGLKTEAVDATFEFGVLTVLIPKVEEVKPRHITVKAR